METAWRVVLYLSLAGMGLGTYLTVVTFVAVDLSYCEPNPLLSCGTVIGSSYSRILGIPVALMGTLGYTGLFVVAYLAPGARNVLRSRLALLGLGLAGVGIAFGTYLTYLELFVIGSVCLLCLTSFLLMVPILVLTLRLAGPRGDQGSWPEDSA